MRVLTVKAERGFVRFDPSMKTLSLDFVRV